MSNSSVAMTASDHSRVAQIAAHDAAKNAKEVRETKTGIESRIQDAENAKATAVESLNSIKNLVPVEVRNA